MTLALPAILRHLDTSVGQVAWVLISFNLVLGLAAVPAARALPRAHPRVLAAIGIAVFALASAWCAAAGSIEVLITARCLQAVGGALALVGCLELLVSVHGERRGVAGWVTAGVVGTAAGPVAGGLLTEAISWQSIFVVQVPFAALAVPAALALRTEQPVVDDRHRPALRPNLTLALLSAALTAALFLLVLLLVDGWRHSPATAAITVSVVPLAAVMAAPLARLLRATPEAEVIAGCLLVAGGLVGLALPPSAHLAWTVAPQALVGLGLGLTVDRLTAQAMELRQPRARHAAWTVSARHLGIVAGLALLTPVFTADLQDAQVPAQEAVTALVIDAPLQPEDKIALARALGDQLVAQEGQVPDLHPAFAALDLDPADRPAADRLERDLDQQLERAATHAFRDSFLVGAGLALLALLTALWPTSLRAFALPGVALVLVAGLVIVQVVRGGGEFSPLRPADPCEPRDVTSEATGIDGLTERLVLLGVDGAACRLDTSREALTLELGQGGGREDEVVDALRAGLRDAVRRMAADGTLPPASELMDEALDNADLNGFVEAALRALPDSLVDGALDTEDVLVRAIDELDLRAVLDDLDDPDQLDARVEAAITEGVRKSLVDRVRDLI